MRKIKNLTIAFAAILLGANVTNAQKFYGVSSSGGTKSGGVVFKLNPDGSEYEMLHEFKKLDARKPYYSTPYEGSNGKLYGLTREGGLYKSGALFSYDLTNDDYENLYSFDAASNGGDPRGSVIQASDGKLYGMTYQNGNNEFGTLFQYDIASNTYAVVFHFDSTNGASPMGSLIDLGDGRLYGMTRLGGVHNQGIIFTYDLSSQILTKEADFDSINGAKPRGNLLQATNGKLYGLTYEGGTDNLGTLFEYDTLTSIITKKTDFTGIANGANPFSTLIEASNGLLYGVTFVGGTDNIGTLFEFNTTTDILTKKSDVTVANWTYQGQQPMGHLVEDGNGKLYGMSKGNNGVGGIYEYDITADTVIFKQDFGDEGIWPFGGLLKSTNGNLYGFTSSAGQFSAGTMVQYNSVQDSLEVVVHFQVGDENGGYPTLTLIQANDANIYGVASNGGEEGNGVIFKIDTATHTFNKLLDIPDNKFYYTELTQLENDKILLSRSSGGVDYDGALYEYDITQNTLNEIFSFIDTVSGKGILAPPIKASNNKYYGVTNRGGTSDEGVFYEWDLMTKSATIKAHFNDSITGSYPSSIIENNGLLYGICGGGGTNGDGTIYSINPTTNQITKEFDLDASVTGSYLEAPFTKGQNNNLYVVNLPFSGTGKMIEYNPTSKTITNVDDIDWDTLGGQGQFQRMVEYDSSIYITTAQGGANGFGTILKYDYIAHKFEVIKTFNGLDGKSTYASLTFVPAPMIEEEDAISELKRELNINVSPNPTNDNIFISFDENQYFPMNYTIVNMLGEIVMKDVLVQNNSKLSLKTLKTGMYIFKVNNDNGKEINQKIIKK